MRIKFVHSVLLLYFLGVGCLNTVIATVTTDTLHAIVGERASTQIAVKLKTLCFHMMV